MREALALKATVTMAITKRRARGAVEVPAAGAR
jgi:hypothetical protein